MQHIVYNDNGRTARIRPLMKGTADRLWYIIFSMTVHLHTRSCYSLLESTIRIEQLALTASEYGYTHTALTDRNVLFGVPSFLKACEKYHVKPIVGMEVICSYHESSVPFVLLARDNTGYMNLMSLSSKLNSIEKECSVQDLWECCRHCFIIAYGEGGYIDSELVSLNTDALYQKLKLMKEELPPFDMALSYQEALLWKDRNALLKRMCASLNIRTAALNKICYLNENEAVDYRIVRAIGKGTNLQDPTLPLIRGRHYLSQQEMRALYEPDDLARTDEIAAECRADFKLEKSSLPVYETKNGTPSSEYLPALCMAGLKKRFGGNVSKKYADRLQYELSVISRMHFENYFLIVYDFIRFARSKKIYIGPGRGSAAGSLVAYCLGITQIDPLKYDLLFERFLNPERVSMPDIDTDIPDDRRGEVIDYVVEKYGHDHVANIVTFGTLGARQAIRDVGKVCGFAARDIDMLTRLIGNRAGTTLSSAYQSNQRFRQAVDASDSMRRLYQTALRLEGLPRHTSTHAAGIVMSSCELSRIVPLISLNEGISTVQYTMEYLEERGLIKMDFLGLRNLTIIDEIVKKIQIHEPDFRIMDIPLDDPEVYELFAKADTTGVFQFESEGMKNLLRKMKPENYEDMTAALALFRPASAESIPSYIANKADPSKIRYPLAALEPVLKSTYGVMIFQEQAMSTARIAAGFTLGRADVLRKAMSKKKDDQIRALQTEFMEGCRRNGVNEKTAAELFELVSRFGGYGFNKSHAVAYGLVAYQTAYVKAHYPLYFYQSLLNSVIGDEYRSSQYIDECRRKKIRILHPDVNRSGLECTLQNEGIMLPVSAVKQVGVHAASAVIEERDANGPFTDFYDFTARMLMHKFSRQIFEQLIDSGALDGLGLNRRTMKHGLDEAIAYGELVQVGNGAQMSIDLGLVSKPVPLRLKDDREELAENEKRALGFCLSEQPIVLIRQRNNIKEPSLSAISEMIGKVYGFALITNVKQHRTKRGEMMAFLRLSDETAEMDIAVMPRLYARVASWLMRGTYVRFNGRISEEGSMIADEIFQVPKK